jgi:hypothetical protein
MRTTTLTFPELTLIAATRSMLDVGLALLLARRLSNEQREIAGNILTAIGLITTVPAGPRSFRQEPASVRARLWRPSALFNTLAGRHAS